MNKFSNLNKLLRVTSWVLRFIKNIKQKKKHEESKNKKITNTLCLEGEELMESKRLWIMDAQVELKEDSRFSQWKLKFDTFTDEQLLLRCRGRLGNALIPTNTKYPILLCNKSNLTQLIVIDAHKRMKHSGVRETLAEVRRDYWIPRGRNLVRKIIHQCRVCRKYNGQHYRYPKSPHLTEERVQHDHAFQAIGIDYAGPLHVKDVFSNNSSTYKAWISLITCTSTRAISLDLATDMTGQECVEVLKRHISKRGAPDTIISDNGSNFKSEEVQNFIASKFITWKFNVPSAPWTGGFFRKISSERKTSFKEHPWQFKTEI